MNNVYNNSNNMNDIYSNQNNMMKNNDNDNIFFKNINEKNLYIQDKKILMYNITFKLAKSFNINLSVINFVSFHWVSVKFEINAFGSEREYLHCYNYVHKPKDSERVDVNFIYNNEDITSSFDPIEAIFKNDSNPIVEVFGKSVRPYKISFKTSEDKK